MQAIVAVDKNWAIGYKGSLLVSIPGDHKMFREKTMGKILIYGRKTLETFPGKKPLAGRRNIILSSNQAYRVRDAEVVHSIDALKDLIKDEDPDSLMVIGGESVYRQLLPWCNKVIATKIDYAYAADAFFANLDRDPDWEILEEGQEQTYFDISYTFMTYGRIKRR